MAWALLPAVKVGVLCQICRRFPGSPRKRRETHTPTTGKMKMMRAERRESCLGNTMM